MVTVPQRMAPVGFVFRNYYKKGGGVKDPKKGGLVYDTIQWAEKTGMYDADDIAFMKATMNETTDANIVTKQRGVQTTLKKTIDYNSPNYAKNCEVLHAYDNGEPVAPL